MQVKDDLELLDIMLEDTRSGSELYKPTNYWSFYEKKFVPELHTLGLKDFRRRKNSVLSSFGATDLLTSFNVDIKKSKLINNRCTRVIPFYTEFLDFVNRILNKVFPVGTAYNISVEDIWGMAYFYAKKKGEEFRAKPIGQIESSLNGNPEDAFTIDGRTYTISFLQYYLYYAYCNQFVNFDKIKCFVELGSGAGKQVEVLKKLYPHICFILFDIPPQLYVCEQYLKSVFGNDVISYRQTREINAFPEYQAGKIYIFGNSRFPILKNANIDLFWNSASFQEMEPDVVMNYLQYVNSTTGSVFLSEAMRGKEIAKKKGTSGVLRQTTLDDYKKGLGTFKLADLTPATILPRVQTKTDYSFSFWKKEN